MEIKGFEPQREFMKRRSFIQFLSITALPSIWSCSSTQEGRMQGCWLCFAAMYRVTPGQKMYSEPGGSGIYTTEKQQVISWEKARLVHEEVALVQVEDAKKAMMDKLAEKLSQANMKKGLTVRALPESAVIPQNPSQSTNTVTKESVATLAVYFSFDKHQLSLDEKKTIDAFVKTNDVYKANKWVLVGRADTSGADQYNVKLSQKRAEQVRQYLKDIGVDTAVVDLQALGEKGADSSARSRRVDIEVRK